MLKHTILALSFLTLACDSPDDEMMLEALDEEAEIQENEEIELDAEAPAALTGDERFSDGADVQKAGAPFNLWAGTKISGGLPSNAPLTTHCTYHYKDLQTAPAKGCFKEYGDHIYVRDNLKDHHSAMAYFEYKVGGGWKNGACVNSKGYDSTVHCDLSSLIAETRVCIWAGWIEMGDGPDKFKFDIWDSSGVCFDNDNSSF